jgi:uncharacterized protein (TIGR03437 family)
MPPWKANASWAQINVRIPANAPSGNVPVDIVVGATHSQPGVTVAVK